MAIELEAGITRYGTSIAQDRIMRAFVTDAEPRVHDEAFAGKDELRYTRFTPQ